MEEEFERDKKLRTFTYIVGLATIISLFIACWSAYSTYQSVFGDSSLIVEYTKGGEDNIPFTQYFYDVNTSMLKLEFLVKNVGYGATAFSIQPYGINCLENCNFQIIYNGNDPRIIDDRLVDIYPIAPKSAVHVMISLSNISELNTSQKVTIKIRDVNTNEKDYLEFSMMDPELFSLLKNVLD